MASLKRVLFVLLMVLAPLGASFATEQPEVSSVVNINTADVATLALMLNGVGQKRAQAIIEHRQQFGAFKTAQELTEVKGIGEALVNRNLATISVE